MSIMAPTPSPVNSLTEDSDDNFVTVPGEWGGDTVYPYPFRASKREFELALQRIPISDLNAEIEQARWLSLELKDFEGHSYEVARIQLGDLLSEKQRRKRLLERNPNDPFTPEWPAPDLDVRQRVERVKSTWPIEQFCTEVLDTSLRSTGHDRWVGRCPLPGHSDETPSFTVYEDKDRAWCFGCNRGGDIIALAGFYFGIDRFYEKLEAIEQLHGSILGVGAA